MGGSFSAKRKVSTEPGQLHGHIISRLAGGPVFAMAFAFPQEYEADCYGLNSVNSIPGVNAPDIQVLFQL
jgi:hypothetical protein